MRVRVRVRVCVKPGFMALSPSQHHKPWLRPGVSVCVCVYKACLPARGLLYISACTRVPVVLLWSSWNYFFLYLSISLSLYLWVDGSFAFVNPWRPSPLPSLLGGDGACAPLPEVP